MEWPERETCVSNYIEFVGNRTHFAALASNHYANLIDTSIVNKRKAQASSKQTTGQRPFSTESRDWTGQSDHVN